MDGMELPPLSASSDELKQCEVCTAANADGNCKDCCQLLCRNCYQTHKKFGSNIDHVLSPISNDPTSHEKLCSRHNEPLEIFCETCQEQICCDCIGPLHKKHNFHMMTSDPLDQKHQHTLSTMLNAVTKKQNDVVIKMAMLANREKEIKDQGELVKQEIKIFADEAIRHLQEELARKVDFITDSKLQVILELKGAAEMSLNHLKKCEEKVKTENIHEDLSSKKQMMEQTKFNQLIEEINVEDYSPKENCDIKLIKSKMTEINIVNVVYTSAVKNCQVKCHQVMFMEDKTFSFQLSIKSSNLSLLTLPLSLLSCIVISTSTTPINNTTVTRTDHPGVYRIHCTPVIRGSHQVNVLIDNIQLESSLVVVPFNPYQEDSITPIHIIEGIDHPFGLAVTEDCIIITEYRGNCLKILNKEDKSIACSVKIDSSPRGIAITPDKTILVTLNHKIWKISMDGKLINSVGRYGSNPLEFSWPCGIAISPITGYVHVTDRYNHRVQVLNPDLTFRFSFGCKGTAQGQFLSPRFIGIDSKGLLYVSDRENHRIQKFTREGHFISLFSMAGSAPGQLKSPESILIENGFLYVSEKDNHRVSVFAMNGSFIRCFGSLGPDKDQFNEPIGMTFDDNNGCLYVCDYNDKRLVVY